MYIVDLLRQVKGHELEPHHNFQTNSSVTNIFVTMEVLSQNRKTIENTCINFAIIPVIHSNRETLTVVKLTSSIEASTIYANEKSTMQKADLLSQIRGHELQSYYSLGTDSLVTTV